MKTKVYAPNDCNGRDYSAAAPYGELHIVTTGRIDRFDLAGIFDTVEAALADSSPNDWIIVTSLNILTAALCGLFAARHKRLNLLLFASGSYKTYQWRQQDD